MAVPINLLSTGLTSPISQTNKTSNTNSVANAQKSFSDLLGQAINKVNTSEASADDAVNQMLTGKADNVHDVMIAMEKSEITLKLAVEVRDKVVNAYQEVMRMQV